MTAHFVNMLNELRLRSLRMASLVEDMLEEACEAAEEGDVELAQRVVGRDAEADSEEVAVEAECVRLLALYQPVGHDLRLVCTILKANNDLERIADCAVNVAERARHLLPRWVAEHSPETARLSPVVRQILRNTIRAYGAQDVDAAKAVISGDAVVDALYGQIIRGVIAKASADPNAIASLLDLLSIAKNLERIADHAVNVAEDVVYLGTGEIVRHRADLGKTP